MRLDNGRNSSLTTYLHNILRCEDKSIAKPDVLLLNKIGSGHSEDLNAVFRKVRLVSFFYVFLTYPHFFLNLWKINGTTWWFSFKPDSIRVILLWDFLYGFPQGTLRAPILLLISYVHILFPCDIYLSLGNSVQSQRR